MMACAAQPGGPGGTSALRSLLLPNQGHAYGMSLQEALERRGVEVLRCDASWGFELQEHVPLLGGLAPDILHLQWPEALHRIREGEDLKRLAERIDDTLAEIGAEGIPIIWTLHNLQPHHGRHREFYARVYQSFAARASGLVHHSYCGMQQALQTYRFSPQAKHRVLRHGYYCPESACNLSQLEARRQLGLPPNAAIYLYCGAFRRDKHIDRLVNALGQAGQPPSRWLLMVGQEKAVAAHMHPQLRLDWPNILWPGRLSFAELGIYIKAADALVSSHGENHLTSAGPHLSQSYLKPLICLRTPYNEEVLEDNALYYEGGSDLEVKLPACLNRAVPGRLKQIARGLEQNRREYHWERIAGKTKSFYEDIYATNN